MIEVETLCIIDAEFEYCPPVERDEGPKEEKHGDDLGPLFDCVSTILVLSNARVVIVIPVVSVFEVSLPL